MTAQEQIANFLDQTLEGTDCFLVEYKLKPTNNYKIYLDSDSGLTLEKCMKVNRSLRRKIEEAELYPDGDFSLEVSSPGVDAPIKMHRQYVKNIGRKLEIELLDEEAPGIVGKLVEVNDETIKVEKALPSKKTKKTEEIINTPIEIPITAIKTAIVCIEF
jgi:ribosome maturation factor RimP